MRVVLFFRLRYDLAEALQSCIERLDTLSTYSILSAQKFFFPKILQHCLKGVYKFGVFSIGQI